MADDASLESYSIRSIKDTMLREIHKVKQYSGEPRRRWFADESMDLFVWYSRDGSISGFQLSYDKPYAERAITWKRDGGFDHARVDDGARPGKHPETPLLLADGAFDSLRVSREFKTQAIGIDDDLVQFVSSRLSDYTGQEHSTAGEAPFRTGSRWQCFVAWLRSILNR